MKANSIDDKKKVEEYGKHISDKYARLFIRNLRSMVKNGESKDSIEAIRDASTLAETFHNLDGLSAEAMERVEIPSGVPLVYRFAPDLSVGAWSRPVRSKVGWVVFKVLERVEGRAPTLAEVRGLVERASRARLLAVEETRLVAELRARAEVEVTLTW